MTTIAAVEVRPPDSLPFTVMDMPIEVVTRYGLTALVLHHDLTTVTLLLSREAKAELIRLLEASNAGQR